MTRRVGGLPRGFSDAFVVSALVRIDAPAIQYVLARNADCFDFPKYSLSFYHTLLPVDSATVMIDDFIHQNNLTDKQLKYLASLKKSLDWCRNYEPEELPPLSDFVLNHPLYKARQAVIETNIAVFKKQNSPAELDENLLTAVGKLGEVRSVEAVEVLVPYLLLKTKSGLKPVDKKTDKKLLSLQEYPIAVALADIGIPSIGGLLNEIAKREKNGDEYRQVAYNVMTSILPQVAIPGFVNATLEKQTDEIAKIRLAKMFPIMGSTSSSSRSQFFTNSDRYNVEDGKIFVIR